MVYIKKLLELQSPKDIIIDDKIVLFLTKVIAIC